MAEDEEEAWEGTEAEVPTPRLDHHGACYPVTNAILHLVMNLVVNWCLLWEDVEFSLLEIGDFIVLSGFLEFPYKFRIIF